MRIVIAAHSHATSPLPVGSVYLAREFVSSGHVVAYVAPPMSPAHLVRLRDPLLRSRLSRSAVELEGGFTQLSQWTAFPPQVLEWSPTFDGPFSRWRIPQLEPMLVKAGVWPVDLLIIDNPSSVGLRSMLRPRTVLYRATDIYPAIRGRPRLADVERRTLAQADGLIATSGPVARHLEQLTEDQQVNIVPNGADYATETIGRSPVPRAVYAGALDQRFDPEPIEALATARPDIEIFVIGPGALRSDLRRYSNVRAHGSMAHHALLKFLRTCHVGILPLCNDPANAGRSPIKVFEYLAAGVPAVASRTEELNRLELPHVWLCDSGGTSFVKGVEAALRGPTITSEELAELRTKISWSGRAATVLSVAASANRSCGGYAR